MNRWKFTGGKCSGGTVWTRLRTSGGITFGRDSKHGDDAKFEVISGTLNIQLESVPS
jgi:hypothetical protein